MGTYLELANPLAELLARVDVRQDDVEGGGHQTQGPAREDEALQVEPTHQHVHALVDLAKHVLLCGRYNTSGLLTRPARVALRWQHNRHGYD
jgi:hypothetical protein